MFTKVVTGKPDICLRMFCGQFYEKRPSVWEKNMNLSLDTVTYIAIKERVTFIITIDTVISIMHCRKYHQHNCSRDSHLDNHIKIVTHIFAAKTITCICAAETSNCITATETVTSITVTEKPNNIQATESTTSKPAKIQQTLSLA